MLLHYKCLNKRGLMLRKHASTFPVRDSAKDGVIVGFSCAKTRQDLYQAFRHCKIKRKKGESEIELFTSIEMKYSKLFLPVKNFLSRQIVCVR